MINYVSGLFRLIIFGSGYVLRLWNKQEKKTANSQSKSVTKIMSNASQSCAFFIKATEVHQLHTRTNFQVVRFVQFLRRYAYVLHPPRDISNTTAFN